MLNSLKSVFVSLIFLQASTPSLIADVSIRRYQKVIDGTTRMMRIRKATHDQIIEALILRGTAQVNIGNLRDAVKGECLWSTKPLEYLSL